MNNKNQILFTLLGILIGAAITSGIFLSKGNASEPARTDDGPRNATSTSMADAMDHSSMSSTMHGMTSGLEGKTGDAFDQTFLEEMITHHEGAVAMAQLVLKVSKRPELIKLANDIIAAQTGEINMMKSWQSIWFKQ